MGIMNYQYKDIVIRIKKLGFILKRKGKGSHEIWFHETHGTTIILPHHTGKNISKGVIKEIIRDLGLTNQAFHDL